jgi:NAD(P)-dependent dehydrogenase (short-subunit alcohol dehydrogenase family)
MENKKAYVVTGPTSGIGYATTLELARHGTNRIGRPKKEQTLSTCV